MILLRIPIIIYLVLLIISISILFGIKRHVANLHTTLKHTIVEINKTQDNLQILEAEWSYLTKPERLKILTEKHLNLQSISYKQVKKDIPTAKKDK